MISREYSIGVRLALLREWFDSWRQEQGYGGMVTHYWGDSLRYVGPAVTQHVGLINGYVRLFDATDDRRWLVEAKEVGRSILKLQDPLFYYSFKYSGLERNSFTLSRVRSLLTNSWGGEEKRERRTTGRICSSLPKVCITEPLKEVLAQE